MGLDSIAWSCGILSSTSPQGATTLSEPSLKRCSSSFKEPEKFSSTRVLGLEVNYYKEKSLKWHWDSDWHDLSKQKLVKENLTQYVVNTLNIT